MFLFLFFMKGFATLIRGTGTNQMVIEVRPSYREDKDELRSLLKMSKRQEEPSHVSV